MRSLLRFHLLAVALLASSSFALALAPSAALAGACPTCTTSAECEALFPGEPAFCVLHDGDVGCGAARQICCPGQGCNTFDGRPSCEAAGTCSVVDGAVDAGTSPGTDAGTMAGTDAGTTPGSDAGPPADGGSGGCGCRVDGRGASRGSLALGALAVLGLARWRRRAR